MPPASRPPARDGLAPQHDLRPLVGLTSARYPAPQMFVRSAQAAPNFPNVADNFLLAVLELPFQALFRPPPRRRSVELGNVALVNHVVTHPSDRSGPPGVPEVTRPAFFCAASPLTDDR